MTRERRWLAPLLVTAAIAAVLALLAWRTEWVEETVTTPARGAALDDPHYALARLVRETGGRFVHRRNLEAMPPAGAVLVLDSYAWDLFPERNARLQAWVRAGGHLVLTNALFQRALRRWVPIADRVEKPCAATGACKAPAPTRATPRPARGAPLHVPASPPACLRFAEPEGMAPALPGWGRYTLCNASIAAALVPLHVAPQWALQIDGRNTVLRVPVGAGTVTVHQLYGALDNRALPRDDDAAAVAAMLQLAPGRVVWLVDDESQPPLPLWLWQQARTAIVLAALALGAWLWRRGRRFGPVVATPPAGRRAVGDQVAGLARFLRRHQPEALHRAARRALDEQGAREIPGYADLSDDDRALAIARACGPRTGPGDLRAALRPGPQSRPAEWLAAVALLEQCRRGLRARRAAAPPGG